MGIDDLELNWRDWSARLVALVPELGWRLAGKPGMTRPGPPGRTGGGSGGFLDSSE